jgi:flagellar basal body-associated protein FliL
METSSAGKGASSVKVVVIAAAVVVVAVVAAAVMIVRSQASSSNIGYATEAKVMLDQDSLQAAMDQAMENAKNGNVALMYKDNAYSTNGTDFECYIVNSASNAYDMYLTIYSDLEMTDELYLSQLVPPGSGFENISLEHPLDTGDHTVYVVLTQVETDEETGEQTAHNQVVHTMDFHVQA